MNIILRNVTFPQRKDFVAIPQIAEPPQPAAVVAPIQYPRWKHLVPLHPTKEDLDKACLVLFKDEAKYCRVDKVLIDDFNGLLSVTSRNYSVANGGILIDYTEEPVNPKVIFDGPGTGRAWDENGDCYYLLDKKTMMPRRWEQDVYPSEVLRSYIKDLMAKNTLSEGQMLLS
jgi:hypothetical protein